MKKMISLTKYVDVPNAAHILYFFENNNNYIENLLAYIKDGLERGHHLLIIENPTIYTMVEPLIGKQFSNEQQKCIHYIDNYSFYGYYGDFHVHNIVENFGEILKPFFKDEISIRTWAHVEWKKLDDISSELEEFENLADCSVNGMGLMSVCAYAATDLSASLQTTLMRSHEYVMTDTELVRSSLYRNTKGLTP